MSPRLMIRPLTAGSTWRRWVYLIIGGAVAWPYVVAAAVLAMIAAQRLHSAPLAWTLVLTCIVALPIATGFIPGLRTLEGNIARPLLGGPVADQPIGNAATWPDRFRTAGWFYAHLLTGAITSLLTMMVPTAALGLILTPFTGDAPSLGITQLEPIDALHGPAAPVIGLAALGSLIYVIASLGAVTAVFAPTMLGPSTAEWQAELDRRTKRLAERNRLARELHDSVGHCLSVVTVQAGAAARVLDRDPAFARDALSTIEESARTALDDLDYVLGVLREDPAPTGPRPTLEDLDGLLEQTRLTGIEVHTDVGPGLRRVPTAVSQEAYRIVQEGLTNVLRHAGKVPVTLCLSMTSDQLELTMTNPLSAPPAPPGRTSGGRGLHGMRERVAVLRGEMSAGPDEQQWRVAVRLPWRAPR